MNIKIINNPQTIEPGTLEHCLLEFPYPCKVTVIASSDNADYIQVNSLRQVEESSSLLTSEDTLTLDVEQSVLHFKLNGIDDAFMVSYTRLASACCAAVKSCGCSTQSGQDTGHLAL